MARLTMPAPDDMNPLQRRIHDDAVAGPRGYAPLPLTAWIHSPALAERATALGEMIRFHTALSPRHAKLAALAVAARWQTPYLIATHSAAAATAGIGEGAIAAILRRDPDPNLAGEDRVVYDTLVALLDHHAVPQQLYDDCVAILGAPRMVELVAVAAYYTFTAMTLNCFELGPRG